MQAAQRGLDPPHRHAQHQRQEGNQAGNAHADTTLPEDLSAQIKCGAVPALAGKTPAPDDLMLDDRNRQWQWQDDHLVAIGDAGAAQGAVAVRAVLEGVQLEEGGRFAAAAAMMHGRTLLARALGIVGCCLIGLDEGRRAVPLLFAFDDVREGCREQLLQQRDLRGEDSILGAKMDNTNDD